MIPFSIHITLHSRSQESWIVLRLSLLCWCWSLLVVSKWCPSRLWTNAKVMLTSGAPWRTTRKLMKTSSFSHKNLTLSCSRIGGSDGILLEPQTRFDWQTEAEFWNLTHFKCEATMNDKKANWTSWAGGYNLHPVWTLKEDGIVSQLFHVVPWLPAHH